MRSRRGEEAFEGSDGGEAGGRDGAAQVIGEVADPVNLAKELAANILSAEVEDEHDEAARRAQRAAESDERPATPTHAADRAQAARAATGDPQTVPRDRDGRGQPAPVPQVEDQTLVELRQAFGREDDGMDMGI